MDIIAGSVPRFLPPRQEGFPRVPSQQQHHLHNHNPSRPLQHMPLEMTAAYELAVNGWTGQVMGGSERQPLHASSTPYQPFPVQFIPSVPPVAPLYAPLIASPTIGVTDRISARTPKLASAASTPLFSSTAALSSGVRQYRLPTRPLLPWKGEQQQEQQQQVVTPRVPPAIDTRIHDIVVGVYPLDDLHTTVISHPPPPAPLSVPLPPPSPSSPSSWTIQDRIRHLGQELRGSATSAIGLPRISRDMTRTIIAQGLAARRQSLEQEMQAHREQQHRVLLHSPLATAAAAAAATTTSAVCHGMTAPSWSRGIEDNSRVYEKSSSAYPMAGPQSRLEHANDMAAQVEEEEEEDKAWAHVEPWQLSLPFDEEKCNEGGNDGCGDKNVIGEAALAPIDAGGGGGSGGGGGGGGDPTLFPPSSLSFSTNSGTVVTKDASPRLSPSSKMTTPCYDRFYQGLLTRRRIPTRILPPFVQQHLPTKAAPVVGPDSIVAATDWHQGREPTRADHCHAQDDAHVGNIIMKGCGGPPPTHDQQALALTNVQGSETDGGDLLANHENESKFESAHSEMDHEDELALLELSPSVESSPSSGRVRLLDNLESFERELDGCLSK
ncbi:hypothetical protein DFQ27_006916 [Actinomortierella ambigua]|uniref:Uncharacterized protein n=1 Tax=Actinomortierella ambigua TaxID=1343610 RepID=A0A9P6PUF5_9FUNG|nr:hypothetical protein DFQ27_006916 [Actinomortierella ambigua]